MHAKWVNYDGIEKNVYDKLDFLDKMINNLICKQRMVSVDSNEACETRITVVLPSSIKTHLT